MDERDFRALLYRTIAIPVLALLLLALALGFTVRQLRQSAMWVDHTDTVIAHANLLTRLMVDQETGLRGYVAFGHDVFLEPFHDAQPKIDQEFDQLLQLVSDNPPQEARLHQIRISYTQWLVGAELTIRGAPDATPALQRKQMMDGIRSQINDFIKVESDLRTGRVTHFSRVTLVTYIVGAIGLLLVAIFISRYIARSLRELSKAYREKMSQSEIERYKALASENWLRTTLRSIGDAVIACDQDGRVVFMNLVAERLTGWTSAEAHDRSLSEVFRIVNATSRAVVESPVEKVRRLGIVVGLANHTVLLRRDNAEVHIDDSGAPILDERGALIGVVLVFRDVTERRKAESALVRAEKLASAGRLSAAIAHEINNPLEALTNLLFLTKSGMDGSEMRTYVEQAETEVARIAHITRQSLGFYRDDSALTVFSVASVVNQTVTFYLSRASHRNIMINTSLRSDLELLGSPGEMRQVLSNLLSNALDACESGGTIRVGIRKDKDDRSSKIGARIVIADSGCGIDAIKIASIFEPFYTTKGSTGTGLGLWVTRQLVEKHGGSIRVRSTVRGHYRGTTFRIFFPSVHADISRASVMTAEGNMN